jgi:hypothetical protein
MQGQELRRGDIIPVFYYPGYKGNETMQLDANTNLHENDNYLAMG